MRLLPVSSLCLLLCVACAPEVKMRNHDPDKAEDIGEHTVSRGFDELEEHYYEPEVRMIWQRPEIVLSVLGNLKGRTVADIGAGTGFFAFRIAAQGGRTIAIDIDPRAIEYMEEEKMRYPADVRALLETRLAQPHDPGLRAGEADVVLMVNTYIYIEDRVAYFRNLRTGLADNARIVIIDFKKKETPIGPTLEERVSSTQVESELVAAGYIILSTDERSLDYQYIITASL